MTATDFNVHKHLASLGRLDARRPDHLRQTLTMKPGKPPKIDERGRREAFDKPRMTMYPEALIDPIFPTDMPRDVYPVVIGPAFAWLKKDSAWEKADAIRGSRIVYDERGSDLDLGDLMWSRLHVAYLLNEIVPDQEIIIHLLVSDSDSIHTPSDASKPAKPTDRNLPRLPRYPRPLRTDPFDNDSSVPHFFETLLEADDDVEVFQQLSAPLSFDEPEPDEGRKVTARTWHEEMLPLARQHFTFMTNARVFIRDLAKRCCTAPGDTEETLRLFKPAIAKDMAPDMKSGLNGWMIAHALVIKTLFAFAESTPAQRMFLYTELVSAEDPEEVRPTLGNDLVGGRYFGSVPRRMRTFDRAAAVFGFLIGAGIVTLDTENRTATLTEGGRKLVDMIGPPLHVREYQRGIVDQLGNHVSPSVIGPTAEAVLMEYFTALKTKSNSQDELQAS